MSPKDSEKKIIEGGQKTGQNMKKIYIVYPVLFSFVFKALIKKLSESETL